MPYTDHYNCVNFKVAGSRKARRLVSTHLIKIHTTVDAIQVQQLKVNWIRSIAIVQQLALVSSDLASCTLVHVSSRLSGSRFSFIVIRSVQTGEISRDNQGKALLP